MKLKDIAELANVSPSTVSLVLNNKSGVSDAKRQEVLKLLQNYGYAIHNSKVAPQIVVKNKAIRLIKCKRHSLLVDGNPGFTNAILDSVEMECRRQGYELNIITCNIKQLNSVFLQIQPENTAGILLLGTELSDQDIDQLPPVPVPSVLLDNAPQISDINCITMNNYDAIYRAVHHLVSYHHKHIGFLANQLPSNNCLARKAAFVDALKRHNIPFDQNLVYEVFPTPDGAYESIKELLANGNVFPSALVANNDSIALGAIKAFKEFGINVPTDISIIGFDNIPLSSVTDPPLSTMEVPCTEMGIWAVRLLCDLIRYPFSASTTMQVSTKLVVRGSTIDLEPSK